MLIKRNNKETVENMTTLETIFKSMELEKKELKYF